MAAQRPEICAHIWACGRDLPQYFDAAAPVILGNEHHYVTALDSQTFAIRIKTPKDYPWAAGATCRTFDVTIDGITVTSQCIRKEKFQACKDEFFILSQQTTDIQVSYARNVQTYERQNTQPDRLEKAHFMFRSVEGSASAGRQSRAAQSSMPLQYRDIGEIVVRHSDCQHVSYKKIRASTDVPVMALPKNYRGNATHVTRFFGDGGVPKFCRTKLQRCTPVNGFEPKIIRMLYRSEQFLSQPPFRSMTCSCQSQASTQTLGAAGSSSRVQQTRPLTVTVKQEPLTPTSRRRSATDDLDDTDDQPRRKRPRTDALPNHGIEIRVPRAPATGANTVNPNRDNAPRQLNRPTAWRANWRANRAAAAPTSPRIPTGPAALNRPSTSAAARRPETPESPMIPIRRPAAAHQSSTSAGTRRSETSASPMIPVRPAASRQARPSTSAGARRPSTPTSSPVWTTPLTSRGNSGSSSQAIHIQDTPPSSPGSDTTEVGELEQQMLRMRQELKRRKSVSAVTKKNHLTSEIQRLSAQLRKYPV